MEQVILVDEQDNQTGVMEKLEAHLNGGTLHRAFSIFVFNQEGKMLLQRRHPAKYHSGGLWTNTCCSHPRPGETVAEAAERRLQEEMGFTTPLFTAFEFVYRAGFGNGLTEHEYDHVFIGHYEGLVQPNQEEVSDYRYQTIGDIKEAILEKPEEYTAWFRIALPRLEDYFKEKDITN